MRAQYTLIGLAAAVLAAWLVGSCAENPTDVPIPNRPPVVSISAGPIRDSVDVFIVNFNWNAWDPDGQIDHFLFAFDDTMPDDWATTESFELTGWVLQAENQAAIDTILVGTTVFERYRFRGAHTFYLKAVDDDGAESDPVSLSFTAETIAPSTQILIPDPGVIVLLGPTFTVTWEGTDIDGTEPPVAYSYRVVPVDNVLQLGAAEIESTLFADPGPPPAYPEPWSPFEPRTSVQLNLQVPQDYIFGVVAMDQAGAVEPRLRDASQVGGVNAMRIRGREEGGQPDLWVSSSVKTTRYPTADDRQKTFQIPANSNVTFTWTADATRYGGRIAGYSYGIDLLDPLGDDPGYSPESATVTRTVLRFDLPEGATAEEHILYVRARDDVGTAIVADINLIVVPLTLDRDVLYVDDFGEITGRIFEDCDPPPPPETGPGSPGADWPHDWCHDQFIREAIARGLASVGEPDWIVDRYEPLDPRNGNLTRRNDVTIDSLSFDYWVFTGPVTLEHLARYDLVVWNVRSEDTGQLYKMNQEGEDNFLAVYLEAGGEVWIMGTGAFSRTRFSEQAVGLSPFGFRPRDFPYRFLKLESIIEGGNICAEGCFRVSGQTTVYQRSNGFEGAYLHPIAEAEGYPPLRVTREPFVQPNKGIPNCEGMVVPLGLDINPRLRLFGGQLDTLYFYQSNQKLQIFPYNDSWMDNSACALRYQGPGQGRLMMFGFPLYYLPVTEVDQVMTASFRWLLAGP